MKINRIMAIPFLSMGMIIGCANQAANAPLPKGAINASDAEINAVLQSAHAAVVQYNADVAGGFVPATALKSTMAALTSSLNIADPLYQAYHATLQTNPGAGEPAQLATAISQINTAMNSLSTIQK